jgi:hypothetical protein
LEESKVVSSHPRMANCRPVLRIFIFAAVAALLIAAHVPAAFGQTPTFTLSPSPFSPSAGVDPGGSATATISVQGSNGFDSPVSLTCAVTSSTITTDLPTCLISPETVTPTAIAGLTVYTVGGTPTGTYTVTVTGTSGSDVEMAPQLFLNVVDVEPDYTVTILHPINPTSVNAGNGAEATVTVTPLGSYTGNVTLSCQSVSPAVVASPVCAFQPPTVSVTSNTGGTSVLTVSTFGPLQNSELRWPGKFYGLGFIVPGIALAGIGAAGARKRKVLWFCLLAVVATAMLALPSCSGTKSGLNNSNNLITPKNSYTLTLTGVDTNGVAPSNSVGSSDQATVSLTVN